MKKRCVLTRFWTAVAERSGDTAFTRTEGERQHEGFRSLESSGAREILAPT
jgi:hypothetical protein